MVKFSGDMTYKKAIHWMTWDKLYKPNEILALIIYEDGWLLYSNPYKFTSSKRSTSNTLMSALSSDIGLNTLVRKNNVQI